MLPNMLVIERKAHAEALTVKHVSESVIVVVVNSGGVVVERGQHCSEATRHTESFLRLRLEKLHRRI